AGAVPGVLARVPLHDAAQMRTRGVALVQRAVRIAVYGELVEAPAHDGAAVARDLVDRLDVAAGQPIAVLRGHVEVFPDQLARGLDRHARGRIELLPRVLAGEDQVAKQHPGDGAVRQAHARIAGGDDDVVVVHRVVA